MPPNQWNDKQLQYAAAMDRYENVPIYQRINQWVSWSNVILQVLLLTLLFTLPLTWSWHLFALVIAYVLADFVNGLVHLYMDHNDHYASIVGPFVAAFHLHHDIPRYRDRPLWRIYIEESGSKIWLVVFAAVWLLAGMLLPVPPLLLIVGIYFTVFSTVAEVSHYLCHNSDARWVRTLQRLWILLPKKHHMRHHRFDNINYAFLNGMTDPVINWIARRCYGGYQSTTDQHTVLYQQKDQVAE
jgi:hypothetical protein